MLNCYGIKWWWIGIVVYMLVPTAAEENRNPAMDGASRLIEAMPAPAYWLFQWPSESVLQGPNRVDSGNPEVLIAKNQCTRWLKTVLAPSWMPPEDAQMVFIRREFDGRDVVRLAWKAHKYRVEVSQTASVFAIRLSPLDGGDTGKNEQERFEAARQLCLKLFHDTGRRWDNQGNALPIRELSSKIVSYSFRRDLARHLKGDSAVCGRPLTRAEAGVQPAQDDQEAARERDSGNPRWEDSASSFDYWFRRVCWWNDGKSVGFYFLKVEEGPWIPSYCGDIDRGFFKVHQSISSHPATSGNSESKPE